MNLLGAQQLPGWDFFHPGTRLQECQGGEDGLLEAQAITRASASTR
jgi:hypothetical protein